MNIRSVKKNPITTSVDLQINQNQSHSMFDSSLSDPSDLELEDGWTIFLSWRNRIRSNNAGGWSSKNSHNDIERIVVNEHCKCKVPIAHSCPVHALQPSAQFGWTKTHGLHILWKHIHFFNSSGQQVSGQTSPRIMVCTFLISIFWWETCQGNHLCNCYTTKVHAVARNSNCPWRITDW